MLLLKDTQLAQLNIYFGSSNRGGRIPCGRGRRVIESFYTFSWSDYWHIIIIVTALVRIIKLWIRNVQISPCLKLSSGDWTSEPTSDFDETMYVNWNPDTLTLKPVLSSSCCLSKSAVFFLSSNSKLINLYENLSTI